MKKAKFLAAEDVACEEIAEGWVAISLAGERYVMDVDALCDMSIRFASFLAAIENREAEDADFCVDCSREVH